MTDEVQKIVNALRAACFFASDNNEKTCNECLRMHYCHDKDADIERDAADLLEQMDAEIQRLKSLDRHGKWITTGIEIFGDHKYICSSCGQTYWEGGSWPSRTHYCPDCGAKMDLED